MRKLGAFALLPVILLLIYLLTLAPTITWAHHGADGGDLVTAVARGSIPHPPGSPTYLLIGELFLRLPWGDPAWRLNVMSAVLAAGAATLTAAAISHLPISILHSPSSILHPPSSILHPPICTGLSLGLAPLFWSQALISEVYAPAAFFTALVAYLALRGGPAWALGLAWGIGTGAHPSLIFLAPLVTWGAWKKPGFSEKTLRAEPQGEAWFLAQAGLLALLGWGAMYGPVLLARGGVPSPWGDVSTLAGWWALVSGQLYHGYLFGLPLVAWPQRVLVWVGLLARQFTPFGTVLAGMGWLHLWRERRALAGVSALSFGAFSLYAIGYNTTDSLVYLVPALPLAAIWLGAGLAQTMAWMGKRLRREAWAILLLPLLQALLFWGQMDVSGDHAATEWAERVLTEAPSQALLLTAQDRHTFTLWYAHDVLCERPDVVIVDRDLWAQSPYRKMVAGALGLEAVESSLSPEKAAQRAGRPVVEVTTNK